MKKNKSRSPLFKVGLVLLCLILVLGVAAGVTMAILSEMSGGVSNDFAAGTVGCELLETVENNTKTSIRVRNTGDSPVFVRVHFVTYWENSQGQIIGKNPPTLSISPAPGWFAGSDGNYYYSLPVSGDTPNLLGAPLSMVQDENGNVQVIQVMAESIQSDPVEAVSEAWGMTVGSDGRLGQ